MGCTNSTISNANKTQCSNQYIVELDGVEGCDIELMVKRREILTYKVVELQKEMPKNMKIL